MGGMERTIRQPELWDAKVREGLRWLAAAWQESCGFSETARISWVSKGDRCGHWTLEGEVDRRAYRTRMYVAIEFIAPPQDDPIFRVLRYEQEDPESGDPTSLIYPGSEPGLRKALERVAEVPFLFEVRSAAGASA
jgi:hypothetical protein